MRVHLLSVPNTRLTAAYELDGFCLRTMLFARLLKRLGHTVVLYGVGTDYEAPCDAFVSCLSMDEYQRFLGEVPYQNVPFEPGHPLFLHFNTRAAHVIRDHKQPGDIIATIGGSAQQFVAEHHPELIFLEYSIGYRGICAPYRIYESHVWRHVVQGFTGVDYGRLTDAVIPPWFPPEDFTLTTRPDDYLLYCGRLVESKGIAIACEAAKAAGMRLVLIGHGKAELVTYGEYLGAVSTAERNRLMSQAKAVLMPTQYLEPFGNVAAEAQLCGTPMITSDFGAFVESVEPGVSGFRCVSQAEYVQAMHDVGSLDRTAIRQRAIRLYSEDAAAESYTRYFNRLPVPAALSQPELVAA